MNSAPENHRTWAEIDSGALRHNFDALKSRLGVNVQVMAVVKANAYGHGLQEVVHALADRAALFGVANLVEALKVRDEVPEVPVFILGPALPEERKYIVQNGFIPAVSDIEEATAYAAAGCGKPVSAHLALDTGMGRVGVWEEEAVATARAIYAIPGIAITGIASHLPVADEDEHYTHAQLDRFHRLAAEITALGLLRPAIHVENSAGIFLEPTLAGTLVRAGLALYGSAPLPEFQSLLRPVLTWKTRVTLIRDVGPGRSISYGRTFITTNAMRIATLAVGYADGFRRHLSHRGTEVLIRGQRCAVLGRVTMDQILVDVSSLAECRTGDEAVLIGAQGAEEILASEMATRAGTIPWDIFTGIGQRVERIGH